MKSSRNVETNYLTQIYRERAYRIHLQKLNDISEGRSLKNKYLADSGSSRAILNNMHKMKQFAESNRLINMQRQNLHILERLNKISHRDPSMNLVPVKKKPMSQKDDGSLTNYFSRSKSVGTVGNINQFVSNAVSREIERKKIARDNYILAERVIFQESEISKRKLDEVYTKFKKIGERLKRIEVREKEDSLGKTFKKGEVEYGRDGRIISKSRILPPLPKQVFHKKFLKTFLQKSTPMTFSPKRFQYKEHSTNAFGNEMNTRSNFITKSELINGERRSSDLERLNNEVYIQKGFEKKGRKSKNHSNRALSTTDGGYYFNKTQEIGKENSEKHYESLPKSPKTKGKDFFITSAPENNGKTESEGCKEVVVLNHQSQIEDENISNHLNIEDDHEGNNGEKANLNINEPLEHQNDHSRSHEKEEEHLDAEIEDKELVKDDKASLQEDKESIKEDKESIKEDKESIKEDKVPIKDDKASLKEDKEFIKEDKESIKEDEVSNKDDKESIKEDNESIKEEKESIKEDKV